jgi:hypothetical protein
VVVVVVRVGSHRVLVSTLPTVVVVVDKMVSVKEPVDRVVTESVRVTVVESVTMRSLLKVRVVEMVVVVVVLVSESAVSLLVEVLVVVVVVVVGMKLVVKEKLTLVVLVLVVERKVVVVMVVERVAVVVNRIRVLTEMDSGVYEQKPYV